MADPSNLAERPIAPPSSPGEDASLFDRALRAGRRAASPTRVGGIYVWALLIVVFALWIPDLFFTSTNIRNIASTQAVTAMVAVGLLLPLAAGIYDLSVGYMLGLAAIFSAYLAHHGVDPVLAITLPLLLGLAVGLLNSLLVVFVGINSFIATLAVGSVLLAGTDALSNGQQIIGLPKVFNTIGNSDVFGIPISVVYLLVLALVAWILLEHTPIGRYLYAIGGAPEAARLAGVRTRALSVLTLVGCALVASAAGVVVTAKLGTGSPQVGPEYLLPAYAAAFLGATQFKSGRFNVPGTLLATYLLATGVTGLQLAGASFWVTDLFNGVVLIGALALSQAQRLFRSRRRSLPATMSEESGAVAVGADSKS